MNKKIELEEYVNDFIAVNDFRTASIIKSEFNGNVEQFYNAASEYRQFIVKKPFAKNLEYQEKGHSIYENVIKFNFAGWSRDDLISVCGKRNYCSAEFMASFKNALNEMGLNHINKGVLKIKGIRHSVSQKWLPIKDRMYEMMKDKSLWIKDASGKYVLNYNVASYTKRQATLIKKFLQFDTRRFSKEKEQTMNKEQTIETNMVIDQKYVEKQEKKNKRSIMKGLNTKLKNEIIKEIMDIIMPKIEEMIERKCEDHYQYVQDHITDLVSEQIDKVFIPINEKESDAESDASEKNPIVATPQNMDDDIDENNSTEDISKWMPDRFIAFVQKGVEKQAVGINVLNSWKCIFTENDFQELYHRCNEQYKNPSFEVNKKNKLNFYKKLLPYLENENFLRFTMPKTKWDNEAGHSVADKQILNSVICEIRKSINMLERN